MPVVTLSDGEPAAVTRLLPWSFDDLREQHLGRDFSLVYRFKVRQPSGRDVDDWIDTSELTAEPTPPALPPDIDPSGWINYRFQADAWAWKQAHVMPRLKSFETARRVRIIEAQTDEVQARLLTPGDYAVIIAAAPVPEVTLDLIARAAEIRFRFKFDGLGLIEAMEKYGLIKDGEPSQDGYDLCRAWEYDVMREWRYPVDEYAALPLDERAALVWVAIRKDIWGALNSERDRANRGR